VSGPLADRVALVTGGAKRLGREIALALARAGAEVAFTYSSSEAEAAETARDIGKLGRRAAAFSCDLRDGRQVDDMVAGAVAAFGAIDVLVLSAAVFRRTPLETATDEDWDYHFDTNARGAYLVARRVGPQMRARGGSIILIGDVAGLRPWGNYIPYSASKAAVIALTQGLAVALAPEVRVNAIAPGPVLAPSGGGEADLQHAAERTLLRRHGSAQDITGAVLYLATANFVTGVVLPVDGGRHLA